MAKNWAKNLKKKIQSILSGKRAVRTKYKKAVPEGLMKQGNIDLTNRPRVINADGSVSTVRSISVGIGEQEVLIPTVSEGGRIMSNEEAVRQYKKTGKHLGKFNSVESANKYAQELHLQQEQLIRRKAK